VSSLPDHSPKGLIIDIYSDGHTPEEQVKQVLNIAAILPGQQPNRRFSIPERNHSHDKVPQHHESHPQSHPEPIQESADPAPAPKGNLSNSNKEPLLYHEPTTNPAPGYTDIKDAPVVPGMAPTDDISHKVQDLDLNQGLDRVASPSLRRLDSVTHELDEFHDAEA
jgi:hypothetical protein